MIKQIKAGTAILFLIFCIGCSNNPRSIADDIMKDISNGDFTYLQGVDGVILYDKEFRTTDRVLRHITSEENRLYNTESDMFRLQRIMFNLPNNILSYDFLDSWDNPDNKYLEIEDISTHYYYGTEYMNLIHDTYDKFKNAKLKQCQENPSCYFDEENEYIKYEETVPEKRYYYKAITTGGIFKVSICMYLIKDEWKVGAIFKENI
ncbi:hypothetical protein [Algoriphagus limi]|uniref:Lipoprotein n=1 Tax=Algoriphagus limi TaxID=2975273 RepID=A0ABT2G219_9BACT|nr:hypothetical protein [Algoriphagus limi]MCS5489301.1 hypothetical protein [Algoriphagus limi]